MSFHQAYTLVSFLLSVFIISVTSPPPPLRAPVEITGELSVCARPAFRLEGAEGGGKTEKERKKRFMLCSNAVLFVPLFPLCV